MSAIGSDQWLNYNKIELFSSCRHLNLTRNRIKLRSRDNSIQMPTEGAWRLQWIGSSVVRMLKIFSRDRHPEVEGDDITVVVASAIRNKQTTRWRMRRCASRLCHNQLITNVEGRSFILLFVRHLSRIPEFCCCCWWRRQQEVALLAIAEMGTAPPIVPGYDMLCASDSIHSPPYIQG